MLKLIAVTLAILYAAACWGTMPRQCFTPSKAIECQRVQLSAIWGWRAVEWQAVHSIRVFN